MGRDKIDESAIIDEFGALDYVIFSHATGGEVGTEHVN
jgi:hypothetical protein